MKISKILSTLFSIQIAAHKTYYLKIQDFHMNFLSILKSFDLHFVDQNHHLLRKFAIVISEYLNNLQNQF